MLLPALRSFGYNTSISLLLITPASSEAATTFKAMSREFSPGLLTPYALLMVPKNASVNVVSKDFNAKAGKLCSDFVSGVPLMKKKQVVGLACLNFGGSVQTPPWNCVEQSLADVSKPCSTVPSTFCRAICPEIRVGRSTCVFFESSCFVPCGCRF